MPSDTGGFVLVPASLNLSASSVVIVLPLFFKSLSSIGLSLGFFKSSGTFLEPSFTDGLVSVSGLIAPWCSVSISGFGDDGSIPGFGVGVSTLVPLCIFTWEILDINKPLAKSINASFLP